MTVTLRGRGTTTLRKTPRPPQGAQRGAGRRHPAGTSAAVAAAVVAVAARAAAGETSVRRGPERRPSVMTCVARFCTGCTRWSMLYASRGEPGGELHPPTRMTTPTQACEECTFTPPPTYHRACRAVRPSTLRATLHSAPPRHHQYHLGPPRHPSSPLAPLPLTPPPPHPQAHGPCPVRA